MRAKGITVFGLWIWKFLSESVIDYQYIVDTLIESLTHC